MLMISFFSSVLRLSPDSPITLFRILIPYCLWVIYKVNRNYIYNLFKISFLLLVIAFIQDFMTRGFFYPNIGNYSYGILLVFCLHYFTIFVVVALVYSLWYLEKNNFFDCSIRYASKVVKFCVLLFVLYVVLGGDNMNFEYIGGNVNNFACLLVAGMLAVVFDSSATKMTKLLYVIIVPLILLYNDSKLALMGAVLVLVLYAMFSMSKKISKRAKKKILVVFFAIFVFFAFSFFTSSSDINGYGVQSLIVIPLDHIKNGEYFDESSSSIAFRTNSVVGIIQILIKSYGLGVGPGNTSFILTKLMPDRLGRFDGYEITSPHIWWLEVMSDLGWLIIIPSLRLFMKLLRSYFSAKSNRDMLFAQLFFLSFPVWCPSASTLYTEYFCIMMISISYIFYKKRPLTILQNNS